MAHTMAELMCTQLVDAATPPACFRGSAHAFHSLRNDALKTNIAAGLLPRLQVVLPLARSRGVLPELAGVLTFWLSNGAAGTTQAAYDLYKQMLANALGGMWPQAVPWFVDSYAQRGCSAAGHMLCCMAAHWGEGGGKNALLDNLQARAADIANVQGMPITNATLLVFLWRNGRDNACTRAAMATMLEDEELHADVVNAFALVLMPVIHTLPAAAQWALRSVPDNVFATLS